MERLIEWWQDFSWRQRLLAVSVGLAILSLGWWLTVARASPEPLPAAIPPATNVGSPEKSGSRVASSGRGSSQASSHDTRVFVDVQGAVKQPGLYQFGPEMRVADAVKAAGGLSAHADRQQVNLATRLTDQQQLYIPEKGEKATETVSTPTGAAKATGSQSTSQVAVVNLNTATVADLQQLTGIGEKKAQKIVDYRTEHGAFKAVTDLTQVPGFGEKTVANLQDQLTT
ncbi:helix-hairpin-helix domain-containing protein [Levilactobacillus fujinensis]|uniref:Helix-hairpin-helix domain-containing protein n=1 Tax=Levilactobacillus fujinensis TaxID=2486024 RepID=A0ABW1TH35_9LACO|nr:helix-hairpin-helix domain-containing protein [Levilactobacillus fujinensis]